MDFSFDHKKENTPEKNDQGLLASAPAACSLSLSEKNEQLQVTRTNEEFAFLNSKILIIGKRGSGKTTLIKDIYRQLQNDLDEVHVFNQPKLEAPYHEITNAVYSDFSLLEDIVEYCRKNPSKKKLLILENHCDKKQLNILDDIFYNGRFMNVTLVIACQYAPPMKPEHRYQLDYIFVANDDFYSNKQKLYTYYFGMFPNLAMFCQIMDSLEQFQFLCTINRKQTRVIKYKPEIAKVYRFIETQLVEKGTSSANKKVQLIKQVNVTIESLIKMRDLLEDYL